MAKEREGTFQFLVTIMTNLQEYTRDMEKGREKGGKDNA